MTYLATPQHDIPCPGSHEIYNFGGPFLGQHFYPLSLSDLCLGVKNILIKIIYFHYITYMASHQHIRIMKFTIILEDPSLAIFALYLILIKIIYFHYITYMASHQHIRIMKFTIILEDPSLAIFALYLICLIHALVQTRGEEILHVHYKAKHKNPCPEGDEIYNCGRPFLGLHYLTLSLSNMWLGVEKIFKKILFFTV